MTCPNCGASVAAGATVCPACGEAPRATGPEPSPKTTRRTFWYAFGIGFLICLVWVFLAVPFLTVIGPILAAVPVLLLVGTYVPAVPQRYRTPLARRFAAGLLVGVMIPFLLGAGLFVGALIACQSQSYSG